MTLVGVMVMEDKVQPLSNAFERLAMNHLGWRPADLELHGHEIWAGSGHWKGKSPTELIAAYEQAISVLNDLEIGGIVKTWCATNVGGAMCR